MPQPKVNIDEVIASAPTHSTKGTRQWFRMRAESPKVADVEIYDSIGSLFDGVTAKDFIAALGKLPETTEVIRVHVSSLGGDVFEALAIANALERHPAHVEMLIEGIAASAATIVTQGGGDVIKIADNALVMIHPPMTATAGDAKFLRSMADGLDRAQAAIIATYQRNTALNVEELEALMLAETWMSAQEALDNGFATEIVPGARAVAQLDPRMLATLATVPEKHKPAFAALARPGRLPVRIGNALDVKAGQDGMSLEDFCRAVYIALRAELGDPWADGGGTGWFIVETYQTGVVVDRNGDAWFYPITIDGDELTLGDPVDVQMVWVAEPPEADTDAAPAVSASAAKVVNVGRMSAVARALPAVVAAAADVMRLCAAAGLNDIAFAQSLLAAAPSFAALPGLIAAEKSKREAITARASEIRAVCAKAGHGDLADDLVASGMSGDMVRKHLATLAAKLDKVEIDANIQPQKGSPRTKVANELNPAAIYADLNGLGAANKEK